MHEAGKVKTRIRSQHKQLSFSSRKSSGKCDQIRSFLWIWSHLLKKSQMENFIVCTVDQSLA